MEIPSTLPAPGAQVVGGRRKHRHQEVLRFLREVEETVPKDQEIHIVLDNYATHRHEKVLDWIERKKRVFLHFTPTSASWANLVERFFATLTEKRIRRGVFTSVPHLEKYWREYLRSYNEAPRPLVWTKSVEEIVDKIGRARATLPRFHNHYFVKDTTLVLSNWGRWPAGPFTFETSCGNRAHPDTDETEFVPPLSP